MSFDSYEIQRLKDTCGKYNIKQEEIAEVLKLFFTTQAEELHANVVKGDVNVREIASNYITDTLLDKLFVHFGIAPTAAFEFILAEHYLDLLEKDTQRDKEHGIFRTTGAFLEFNTAMSVLIAYSAHRDAGHMVGFKQAMLEIIQGARSR